MLRLVACPHCSVHVKLGERCCPHCDGRLPGDAARIGLTAGALLLGLSLGGCTPSTPPRKPAPSEVDEKDAKEEEKAEPPLPVAEPEYGMPVLDDPLAPIYGFAEPLPRREPEREPERAR